MATDISSFENPWNILGVPMYSSVPNKSPSASPLPLINFFIFGRTLPSYLDPAPRLLIF